MHHRAIGDTTVTLVGVGDVSLARADQRGVAPQDVERALHAAIDGGITLVDASEDAERLAGDALRALRLRDRVVLATHVTPIVEKFGRPLRDVLPERLPAGYMVSRIESSLRATRLDALPLAFLSLRADWLTSSAYAELTGTCVRMIREGKVLRFGVRVDLASSEDLAADLAAFAALADPFVALTTAFNACDRRALPLLSSKLAVLAREPLAGAALAGVIGPGVKLEPRDDRQSLDDTALERIAVGVARLANLIGDPPPAALSCDAARAIVEQAKPLPHVEASSLAELCLRFVIDRGAIAMPRLHRSAHLPTAFAAGAAQPLSTSVHAAIERAV